MISAILNQAGGSGSGGYVFVDPLSIVNNGIIDVSDGSGSSLHGGLVGLDSANISGTGSISGSIAPEPGTMVMLAVGLALLAFVGSRPSARATTDSRP